MDVCVYVYIHIYTYIDHIVYISQTKTPSTGLSPRHCNKEKESNAVSNGVV